MVSIPCYSITASRLPKVPLLCKNRHSGNLTARQPPTHRTRSHSSINVVGTNTYTNPSGFEPQRQPQQQQQPRTLFPGGFKRPEIKVPTLVLRVSAEEVLNGDECTTKAVDAAVSKGVVEIVLLHGRDESGGRLYEAACALQSLIRDRAYLLISERVDIAAAVGASGVVLSDQGLPAIVARGMMMRSKSESILLPLVARTVQTADAAAAASSSEGADFLIIVSGREKYAVVLENFILEQHVKVPVFMSIVDLIREVSPHNMASKLIQSGASGMVLSLDDMKLFSDDIVNKLFSGPKLVGKGIEDGSPNLHKHKITVIKKEPYGKKLVSGFTKLDAREIQFIEEERLVILEVISIIRKAAPLMKEVSLLVDAVSCLDQPFLLVVVGEFNSGKSTVINALLGKRYLKEGVVPTTNEITLLSYSETDSKGQERCERHPDGQFICYLSAPILKEMNIVDTPGTNVILQRQQRLTEEYVPRADLVLFVLSSDRPLTESEVTFLHYVQQWKKKVVFVLNKSDLFRNTSELEEAIAFIRENTRKLLNTEPVTLYPVSARSALEAKLYASLNDGRNLEELLSDDSRWMGSGLCELENFLFSFLDGSTDTGMERMKLKLETPISIADRLLSTCETLVKQELEYANKDLSSVEKLISSVKEYTLKLESESIPWKKRTLSLVETTKARVIKLIESTLQLSNIDLIATYAFRGEKSSSIPASLVVQDEVITPTLSDAQGLLGEYLSWLQSNSAHVGKVYLESFEKRWPGFINIKDQTRSEISKLLDKVDEHSISVLKNFSAAAAARLFEQEIREVVLGTFGGLGAAGLSASLLTSVLPTTLEDLLALAFCSTGGFVAISRFPARRKEAIEKVGRVADALSCDIEEAMQEDLLQTIKKLEHFVEFISKPYKDAAQNRINQSSETREELASVGRKLKALKFEIQNIHVS